MGRGRNAYGRILGVLRHYTPNEAPRVHTEIRYGVGEGTGVDMRDKVGTYEGSAYLQDFVGDQEYYLQG